MRTIKPNPYNRHLPYGQYDYYRRRRRRGLFGKIATATAVAALLYAVSPQSCKNNLLQIPSGGSSQGQGNYGPGKTHTGRGGDTGSGIFTQLDPKAHLDEAEKVKYEVQAKDGKDPSQNSQKRNAPPTLDDKLAEGDGRENYERETSLIIPRPTKGIDDTVNDAIVVVDLSSSMGGSLNGNGVYMPAVAAIAVARHYIQEKGSTIAGVRFNHGSEFTNYTTDLDHLVKFFAQRPTGGTALDFDELRRIATDPNRPNKERPVDFYLIGDLGFQDIVGSVDDLKPHLGKIYILIVGYAGDVSGLFGKEAYRAPLNDQNDLLTFYRRFTQDNKSKLPLVP